LRLLDVSRGEHQTIESQDGEWVCNDFTREPLRTISEGGWPDCHKLIADNPAQPQRFMSSGQDAAVAVLPVNLSHERRRVRLDAHAGAIEPTKGKKRDRSMRVRDTPKILVVDDEPMIREMVAGVLRSQGLNVSTAENGNQAVDVLQHDARISLAILDWRMPGMTGEQVFDLLVEIRSGIKVIVVSGDSLSEVKGVFCGRDVFCFLPKPFRNDTLITIVKSALSRC